MKQESVTVTDVVKRAYENSYDKGFWDHEPTFAEKIALIHSELSEALEDNRAGNIDYWTDGDGKPHGELVELADALIRICDLAGHLLGIEYGSFEEIVIEKMKYNETRPKLHGKKY